MKFFIASGQDFQTGTPSLETLHTSSMGGGGGGGGVQLLTERICPTRCRFFKRRPHFARVIKQKTTKVFRLCENDRKKWRCFIDHNRKEI